MNGFTKQKKMNISKEQYFYLISGLPDLSIQDVHLPFSAKIFLDELKNKIAKKDFKLVCMLYYPRDNRNFLHILFNKNDIMQPEGCYSLPELKKGVEENVLLPRYMNNFPYHHSKKIKMVLLKLNGKPNSRKHISKKQ